MCIIFFSTFCFFSFGDADEFSSDGCSFRAVRVRTGRHRHQPESDSLRILREQQGQPFGVRARPQHGV